MLLTSPTPCDAKNPATSFPLRFLKHRNTSPFALLERKKRLWVWLRRRSLARAFPADNPWTAGFLRRKMMSWTAPCVLSVQFSQRTRLRILRFVCHKHLRAMWLCSSSAALCFFPHSCFFIQHLVTTSSCVVALSVCVCVSFESLKMAVQTQRRLRRPPTQ